jgi:hypothetical protein
MRLVVKHHQVIVMAQVVQEQLILVMVVAVRNL